MTTTTQVRVRYAETDQMGYVYYGNYAIYLEVARTEWVRNLGISYKEMEENWKIMLPVYSLHIDYKNPAKYDELLTIETKVTEPKGARLEFHHFIYNPNQQLVVEASVVLVFVNKENMKPCKPPQKFLELYYAKIH
jgi:acyl-CoA thioester hydrolase